MVNVTPIPIHARSTGTGHFCPACLKRVPAAAAVRRVHQETCHSGVVDMSLLHCPTCGLALAAEAELPAAVSVLPGESRLAA